MVQIRFANRSRNLRRRAIPSQNHHRHGCNTIRRESNLLFGASNGTRVQFLYQRRPGLLFGEHLFSTFTSNSKTWLYLILQSWKELPVL